MNAAKRVAQAVVLFLALLAIVSAPAQAQTSNGTLVGSVTDPTGAVVPNAAVSAVSTQYGQHHETHTDSIGTYRLESLQPGVYVVTITASGFEILTVNGVVINGSLTTTINGKLALAAAQQTIEVQATAAQAIDTQSGELGGNISREEITELPYASLNPAELAMTLPGVQDTPLGNGAISTDAKTEGIAFTVNGTRPRANNFLVDGQDDNDYGITGQAYQPTNYGAIEEVAVMTNSYSAEYGHGGGSVINYIYKSGTNNFHGGLWEINRNSALASIPAQDAVAGPVSSNPYDNENTFGFNVGGPVMKDKLFAFGTAQWDRESQAATGPEYNLPTAAGIATLQSLEPNANIALFLASIGSLHSAHTTGQPGVIEESIGGGRPDVEIGPFQVQNVSTHSASYDWNYRMDWHFTDRDVLTGSVIRDRSTLSPDNFANPNALPNFQTQQGGPTQIFRGQWAHTFSSTIVNELRLSYTSLNFGFNLTPATSASPLANTPFISFGNDINFPSIGVDSNFPQARAHKAWEVQEALSYVASRHTIKAGVDVTILNLGDTLALDTRGSITYNFSTSPVFSSLGNFIDDFTGPNPGTISRGFGNPNINASTTQFAPFIEDTWRIKNNLTMTMGLRYEYYGPLANSLAFPAFNIAAGQGLPNATDPAYATDPATYNTLFSFKQVTDKRNFAPRLGLAYTPHWGGVFTGEGKTTFRAGYGIYYDGLFTNIIDNSAESQPNTLGGSIPSQTGRGKANASIFPGVAPTFNSSLFVESMASNLHSPLTQQWNVDVERELPMGLILSVAYVGTRGEHLFATQDYNPQVNYSFTNPNFGELGIRTNAGDSMYNAAQVEVERKIHSLIVRAAYTYSKFMDDNSDPNLVNSGSSYSQILTDQHSDWGPSSYDRRHRFTFDYVWRVPYIRDNAFFRALTDQWEWSANATIETGTPNSPEDGFDNIGNGHPNSRPDLVNPSAPLDLIGIDGGNPNAGFTPGVYYDFICSVTTFGPCPSRPRNDYHFVVPASGPGNAGRNSIFGPGQAYFDTAIQRDFPIHLWKLEGQTISFRTELFNAFNHPNLFTPSYTLTDANYNNPSIWIAGGRQIRLWLKYSF